MPEDTREDMPQDRPASRPAPPALVAKVAAALVSVSGLITLATQWKDVRTFLFPTGSVLSWPFLVFCLLLTNFVVWFIINQRWYREHVQYQYTKLDFANLEARFNAAEQERLTDVITGVSNEAKLIRDVGSFYSTHRASQEVQLILIDINDFRSVNKRFGFLKGDELLRNIAQSLYHSMRRNEEIYKLRSEVNPLRPLWKRIYRRCPGGDEFVFLIEGSQPDAVGFVISRLVPEFQNLSNKTLQILGETRKLTFDCSIAPLLKGDSFDDAFAKIKDCHKRAADAKADFAISWFPETIEQGLLQGDYRLALYQKIRKTFVIVRTIIRQRK